MKKPSVTSEIDLMPSISNVPVVRFKLVELALKKFLRLIICPNAENAALKTYESPFLVTVLLR